MSAYVKGYKDLSAYVRSFHLTGILLPGMAKDVTKLQKACLECQEPLDVEEFYFSKKKEPGKTTVKLLLHRVLPSNRFDATKIK